MFNLFTKRRQKIVILSNTLLFLFWVSILGLIISTLSTTIQPEIPANHAYAELSSPDKSSPLSDMSYDAYSSEIIKTNLTQIMNQDNIFDKMEFVPLSNKAGGYENLGKNETNLSTGSTKSITNTVTSKASGVTADFNGDGFSDLAIGVPNEDVGTIVDAGAVNVIYGSSNGLNGIALSQGNGRDNQIWTQAITGGAEPGDRFGASLATGDFNKDGFSDLAIGVPFEDIGTTKLNAGAVNVIYGSSGGLSTTAKPSDIWHQDSPSIEDIAFTDDMFGFALATGDINGDGFSDMTVGIPGKGVNTEHGVMVQAGRVHVIYGSLVGLSATAFLNQFWDQGQIFPRDAEFGDLLGRELATGDFNKDGFSDLAIGVPGEDVGIIRDAGAVNVIYGKPGGLLPPLLGILVWTQNTRSVEGDANINDMFGSSLTTGDFNKDRISDLAIGVPGENVGTIIAPGAVNVIYGTSNFGLRDVQVSSGNGRDDQLWTQDSVGIEDIAEFLEEFGSALATGDFNKDGTSDLAIGVPHENVDIIAGVGAVNVIYGSSDGLSFRNLSPSNGRTDQIWHQNSVQFGGGDIDDDAEAGDMFGFSLKTGDFNKDGISDLAIGVPQESVGTIRDAGAVNVIYGSLGPVIIEPGGLSATVPPGGFGRVDQLWTQDSPNIEENLEASDQFGWSLG